MQNYEYQKKIEVPAAYTDLTGHECAILVDMSMGMLYEQPVSRRPDRDRWWATRFSRTSKA